MRAWTVDADDIRVAEDFDDALLHRTPEIDAFLAPDRDDKFIVIGTKGFGKTLLLKAKRILVQRDGRAACLPSGSLLDKPIGDKIFSREAIGFFAGAPLPWSKVWLTAIALALLKHARATEGLKVNARLAGLLRDAQLHGVIDHFVRLLDLTPSELQRAATDTDGHLVPRLRALKTPVAIFVDGIDEYFNKHVEERPTNPSVTGELSPQVWYFAQLGLVEVAYQLRRINHHLKVYAAIRKEAYAALPRRTAMAQQYRGSAVDIVYSPQSLREIFVNNVRLVKAERMVRPSRARTQPLEAFLGRTEVHDASTHETEDALEYLCRHTLLRPRDLMTIGERLVALRPEERQHEHRMKEAVHQAAGEIALEYLAEVAPYIGEIDIDAWLARLPGPVLKRAELEALGGTDADARVPWALYRVGLLGLVQHDRARGEWRQRFLRPGEAMLEPDGTLPPASHYLVHPVLSDLVGRANPAFLQRMDRVNVLGYDRPWREVRATPDAGDAAAHAEAALQERRACVLKADVHGFSALMRAGTDEPVRRVLRDAVRRWAPAAAIVEAGAGDAALIVADDPIALAQMARHLVDEVYQAPGQPRLRVALHCGPVRTRMRGDAPGHEIAGGEAVLYAARVEPVVEPGQIWATDEFRQQLQERPSLWRTVPLAPADGGERFDVAKPGSAEGELWVRLYRLEM
jgi:class 3 adenylate cyclase